MLLYADFVLAYEFRLNGAAATGDSLNPNQPLLYILRNALGLNGPNFGSGLGPMERLRCIDRWKNHVRCITPVRRVADKTMMIIEGRGSQDKLDPAQAALIAEQAARCGYWTNGMMIVTKALLDPTPKPTREAKQALKGTYASAGPTRAF